MLLRRTVNEFISSSVCDTEVLKRELHNDMEDILYRINSELNSLPREYNKELFKAYIEILKNQAKRVERYEEHKNRKNIKTIDLKDLITDELDNSSEQMGFIRAQIRRAIVDIKIGNDREGIEFRYLTENDTKYYKLVNALADSVLSGWDD